MVSVMVSDFVKIANKTPIIGWRYINTATSVDVNLLKAYPFKKYVIQVVPITTKTIGKIACFKGRLSQSTSKNWLIPRGKLNIKPIKNNHLKRVIKSYFSAIGFTIIR